MQLPQYVKQTLEKLNEKGYSAYLVGGCVRDTLMGRVPDDFDITTNALPDEIEEVFSDEKTLDIGKKHGTITVVYGKVCVEVTTYRIDGEYGDNRHPKSVEFTDNIELDLKRRDFTVNAIALSPKHGYCDPFGGKEDISAKLIRCVGNPDERFNEDGLRIMRGIRFAATLGFEIEKQTSLSIKNNAHLLVNISAERITTEFLKLICGCKASEILIKYSDVISVFLPELLETDINKRLAAFEGLRHCNEDRIVRLCLFFSMFEDISDIEKMLKRHKLDNKTVRTVTSVCTLLRCGHINDRISIKKTISKEGFENTRLLYKTLAAIDYSNAEMYINMLDTVDDIEQSGQCVSVANLDIDGKIIMDRLGIGGKKIASVLSFLLDLVITEKCENTLEALVDTAIRYWSEE